MKKTYSTLVALLMANGQGYMPIVPSVFLFLSVLGNVNARIGTTNAPSAAQATNTNLPPEDLGKDPE